LLFPFAIRLQCSSITLAHSVGRQAIGHGEYNRVHFDAMASFWSNGSQTKIVQRELTRLQLSDCSYAANVDVILVKLSAQVGH
jgi:hypothetical protein